MREKSGSALLYRAAFLFGLLLDLAGLEHVGVLHEILHAGVHGGDKDHHLTDDVQTMGDAEQDQADAHHGAGSFDLARPGCGDDPPLLHGDQPHAGHGELPHQHDGKDPRQHVALLHEAAQRRHHKALVRQRIHELAEVGDLIIVPGDVAVGKVRQAGHDVHAQRPIPAAGKVHIHQHQKHRDHQHTADGQIVGHIFRHGFTPLFLPPVRRPWRR